MSETNFKPFDPFYDYTKDLTSDEIKIEKGGRQFVYLRGLERLAKERGIKTAICKKIEPVIFTMDDGRSYPGGYYCTYSYEFFDGCVYEGSADANLKNCDGNFALFTAAMAESRAKARALRTAFGISMCSVEEKADVSVADENSLSPIDTGPIADAQIVLLQSLAKKRGLGISDLISMLDIPRDVKSLKELSKLEATELASKLNRKMKAK